MTRKKENEFKSCVKTTLGKRVGYRCSNPCCRLLTVGPQKNEEKTVNLGKAAHITAASPGGPRYNESLTPKERASLDNGIWLCARCADHVDKDVPRYPVALLKAWKQQAEASADKELQGNSRPEYLADKDLLLFFKQCFERPAFQEPFRSEGIMEAFDLAIEDTIAAFNTGSLHDRRGRLVAKANGKAFLENKAWKADMDRIVELLHKVRKVYSSAIKSGDIKLSPRGEENFWYNIRYQSGVVEKIDRFRSQALAIFSSVCRDAGIAEMGSPRYDAFPTKFDQHQPLDKRLAEQIFAVRLERSPLLRDHNFGFRFSRKDIEPFSRLNYILNDPIQEFLDPGLESLRQALQTMLSRFCTLLGLKTAPVRGMPGVSEALPFEDDDHIGFRKTQEELNEAASQVDALYTNLAKAVRKELGVDLSKV